MTRSALDDARIIGKGIRLGGAPEIVRALDAALAEGPLTPDRIEQLAHPDWDRLTFEEQTSRPVSEGADAVGLARLYGPDEMDAAGLTPSWGLAAAWYGWLPGTYTDRTAALLAYGYILGNESGGLLEELRDRITRDQRRPITSSDLIAFAGRGSLDA
ncbi:hypothetical protein KYY02_19610 [Streptomyces pimonensis]|uniref:Uncharacterized protein n=1 Tax=Streptomyces pimonensis TaxID=2860288 RepID=A0ABV4J1L8_9ACTN